MRDVVVRASVCNHESALIQLWLHSPHYHNFGSLSFNEFRVIM